MKKIGLFLLLLATGAEGSDSAEAFAASEINAFESAISFYKINMNELPPVEKGLRALVEVRAISKLNDDPWGNPYCYLVGDGFDSGYGIYSRGPDGQSATQGNDADDICSWRPFRRPEDHWELGPFWALCICATAIIGFEVGRLSVRKSQVTRQGIPPVA